MEAHTLNPQYSGGRSRLSLSLKAGQAHRAVTQEKPCLGGKKTDKKEEEEKKKNKEITEENKEKKQ